MYFPMATESGQAKTSYPQRTRKPMFLYGDALRAKRGREKSQTSETVTKITTRNVNKILLQAAHSPPHTQHLPPPEGKVKTYKVCVCFKEVSSRSLGRSPEYE